MSAVAVNTESTTRLFPLFLGCNLRLDVSLALVQLAALLRQLLLSPQRIPLRAQLNKTQFANYPLTVTHPANKPPCR